MDVVSFETAKKLKAAGFPQPEFACWQVWYNEFGIGTFLPKKVPINGEMFFPCYSLGSGDAVNMMRSVDDGATFAPSAADLLKEKKAVYLTAMQAGGWGVFQIETRSMIGFHYENPAEACAKAYLFFHYKNQ
jgi:hypothetical protein